MKPGLDPVIKWSGSKRVVAPALSLLFPATKRFFDPFVGGGAILGYRPARIAIVGDIIAELISLWTLIKESPDKVVEGYKERWLRLQEEGHTAYYDIRDRFNAHKDPLDLLFLTRTCVNGLVRFNSNGEFNNSLHHTRPGISPDRLRHIVHLWHHVVRGVSFHACDYRETLSVVRRGDVVFLDPPYASTRGRYRPDVFDLEAFYHELERLNKVGAFWMLTFDGQSGERVYKSEVPEDLYQHKFQIPTGNAPFTKLMEDSVDAVLESVYLNFEPSAEALTKFRNFRDDDGALRLASNMQKSFAVVAQKLKS